MPPATGWRRFATLRRRRSRMRAAPRALRGGVCKACKRSSRCGENGLTMVVVGLLANRRHQAPNPLREFAMMSLKQLLHAALGAALLSIVSAHADTLYTVTDLGSLGRDAGGSKAYAINERGQVTGVGAVPLPNPTNAGGHAFLYDPGSMMELGRLWRDSFGQAINNRVER